MRAGHVLAVAIAATTLAVAGCGGDGDEPAGGSAKRGGSITIAQSSQPDALDPALAYTSNSWEPLWLVYTPPLTYRRAQGREGTELIPGTADALPDISADGRTYTFRIRKGIKYSNGRPVRAGDFEHSIKRVLTLESGGTPFFEGIEGATEYLEGGDPKADIPGIEADDATGKVTVRLTAPDATFQNVLAMTFSGMVPSTTPFENLTKDPPPGYGPYEITKSVPNREFVMEQVRGFEAPDIPGGNLQRITTKIVKSVTRQAQDVIDGRLDYMQSPPPADLLPEVRSKYKDRYEEFPTVSTYYFFLNSRTKPFDKKKVREAVNVAIDSNALARLFGGRLEPTCNFLPKDLIGYQKIDPCPFGDPGGPGDPERARRMIEEAGAEGDRVTVYTNTDENRPEIGQYYADLLDKIGLKAKLRRVDGAVYLQTIGNQRTRAQTGHANFFQDFPHPANFLSVVDGESIQRTNNGNYGNVNDPEINREIAALKQEPDLKAVADRWAAIDRKLIEEAYVAPYGSEKLPTFLSERMDFENCTLFHPLYQNDYSSFCLK